MKLMFKTVNTNQGSSKRDKNQETRLKKVFVVYGLWFVVKNGST